jgi:hypothetical protein
MPFYVLRADNGKVVWPCFRYRTWALGRVGRTF